MFWEENSLRILAILIFWAASQNYVHAAYCYRRSRLICRSVCHDCEPCKSEFRSRCCLGCGLGWAQGSI